MSIFAYGALDTNGKECKNRVTAGAGECQGCREVNALSCIGKGSELTEQSCLKHDAAERIAEKDSPILDKDARYILESLNFNSFDNSLNAFENFLSSSELFCGSTPFMKSAHALDIAGLAFSAVDTDHDFVMTKDELDTFVAEHQGDGTADSLSWLTANFDSLEKMAFFLGGITKNEIEAARDVFYGLGYMHENFDKVKGAVGGDKSQLSDKEVADYLNQHGAHLDDHHARGLAKLVEYLSKAR